MTLEGILFGLIIGILVGYSIGLTSGYRLGRKESPDRDSIF